MLAAVVVVVIVGVVVVVVLVVALVVVVVMVAGEGERTPEREREGDYWRDNEMSEEDGWMDGLAGGWMYGCRRANQRQEQAKNRAKCEATDAGPTRGENKQH